MVTTAAPTTNLDKSARTFRSQPGRGIVRRTGRLRHFAASATRTSISPTPSAPASAPPSVSAIGTNAANEATKVLTDPGDDPLAPIPPRAAYTVTSVDGTRLQVHEYGLADGPTVVLVHGWTCLSDFWTPQIRALAREAHVIAYDQRGHGRSSTPGPAGYTSDALADDLHVILENCVPDGNRAVVVGHSMGAMTLIACAGRHPGVVRTRVRGALLASTGVCDLVPSATLVGLPQVFDPVFKPLARLALVAPVPLGRPTPLSNRAIRFLALTRSATAAQVEFCERIILGCPGHVRGRFGAAMATFDLLDAVRALTVPTSVVVGSADRLTPPLHAAMIAATLPDLVELRELPGIGHMTPIEAADTITDMIRNTLAAASARR